MKRLSIEQDTAQVKLSQSLGSNLVAVEIDGYVAMWLSVNGDGQLEIDLDTVRNRDLGEEDLLRINLPPNYIEGKI